MLILIAESKTMAPCDGIVDRKEYLAHRPALEEGADAIMDALRDVAPDELAARTRLSLPMVRKLQQMVYEFPNKATGTAAIEAFTGVVFKAFGYPSLDDAARSLTCGSVRVISSLYGWLRPDDIVKPYRFDFTTPAAPDGKTLAAHWRNAVTDCLVRELTESGCSDILNLLPGDAARCIDMKEIGRHARVWKADFKEVLPGGDLRTPNAGRLKTLRGRLLRRLMTDSVTSAALLPDMADESFVGSGSAAPDGTIIFHTMPA